MYCVLMATISTPPPPSPPLFVKMHLDYIKRSNPQKSSVFQIFMFVGFQVDEKVQLEAACNNDNKSKSKPFNPMPTLRYFRMTSQNLSCFKIKDLFVKKNRWRKGGGGRWGAPSETQRKSFTSVVALSPPLFIISLPL